jgi:hypothetical protein
MLIFALAMTVAAPLNETHMRDIACVAVLGIVADEQRRGVQLSNPLPDVQQTGRRWTGIVGERVMAETGQPRELVAVAITEAVRAEQNRAGANKDPASAVRSRLEECLPLMQAQLAEADAAGAPLPKPVKAQ